MPGLYLMRAPGGVLVPADQPSLEIIERCPLDAGFHAMVRHHNNIQFHRKMMVLLQLAYDQWEPGELRYQGVVVRKNFEQFRKDLTILAGFYDAYVDYSGRVRLVAKSLNFSRMSQLNRERLYSSLIDVLLARILKHFTRGDVEHAVAQLLEFDR